MLAVPAGGFEQLCSLLQAVGGSEVQLRSRERDCTAGDVGASRCVTHLGLQGRAGGFHLAAAGGRWLCSTI